MPGSPFLLLSLLWLFTSLWSVGTGLNTFRPQIYIKRKHMIMVHIIINKTKKLKFTNSLTDPLKTKGHRGPKLSSAGIHGCNWQKHLGVEQRPSRYGEGERWGRNLTNMAASGRRQGRVEHYGRNCRSHVLLWRASSVETPGGEL